MNHAPQSMNTPLRLAILWHQHQPYYKTEGEYLLPWTRLHGTKDYLEMARTIEEFTDMRATINVVPSLLLQLRDYSENNALDSVLRISRMPAHSLGDAEKQFMLEQFFLCNVERMVLPWPRYAELYHRSVEFSPEECVRGFSDQDWLDLQTWYALTWIGEHAREEEPFQSLLQKGQNFTEEEKQALLDHSIRILGDVIPAYRRLADSGQIELSVTPFYHPILPVLCDSFSALEAMPNATLPEQRIAWPEDAAFQIKRATTFFRETFGREPLGMWPSEGSVSTTVLELIRSNGLGWAASDEEILRRTLGNSGQQLAHCFPWRVQTPAGPLRMLFRDREISDAIGFVYASMDHKEAAQDFVAKVLDRRERIIAEYGEQGLNDAILPVILDGENCWEYYSENGRPFLRELYRLLTEHELIRPVTMSEGLTEIPDRTSRTLGRIAAGSWIGGNFRIWIGHEEDNLAWDLLAAARDLLFSARGNITEEQFHQAYEEILMAEGSDWFWWYGDENTAANEDDFDRLFREHIRNVYHILGLPAPERLNEPIHQADHQPSIVAPTALVRPLISGNKEKDDGWQDAGQMIIRGHGGAMHRADITEARLLFGTDGENLYLRYEPSAELDTHTGVRIVLRGERTLEVGCRDGKLFAVSDQTAGLSGINMASHSSFDVALHSTLLGTDSLSHIELVVELYDGPSLHERVPAEGSVKLGLA